jgi:hypothetical protein
MMNKGVKVRIRFHVWEGQIETRKFNEPPIFAQIIGSCPYPFSVVWFKNMLRIRILASTSQPHLNFSHQKKAIERLYRLIGAHSIILYFLVRGVRLHFLFPTNEGKNGLLRAEMAA